MHSLIARYPWLTLGVSLTMAAAVFITLDLLEDPDSSWGDITLNLLEETPLVAATVFIVLLVQAARRQREMLRNVNHALEISTDESRRWREQAKGHTEGLRAVIEDQFTQWNLSPAEREVALLLLKGLSTKEAALVRGTSERTTSEQARAVYAKAGLAGRAELAAFFLEDLLAPSRGCSLSSRRL